MRFGSSKSYDDLDALRAGNFSVHNDDVYTARKMGKLAVLCCLLEGCLFTFIGVGWNFDDTSTMASAYFYGYLAFRILLSVKSMVDHLYFVNDEARIARNQQQSGSQLINLQQSSRSLSSSALPSDTSGRTISPPPRPVSFTEQRSTAREGQQEFGVPIKTDTEAEVGGVILARRRTNPPQPRE